MTIVHSALFVQATAVFVQSRTLVERFRDWDWRLEDLTRWVHETCVYWIDNLGMWGWAGVGLVTLAALLSWDLTRGITTSLLSRIGNGIISMFGHLLFEFLTFLAHWTGSATIASARNAMRYSTDDDSTKTSGEPDA